MVSARKRPFDDGDFGVADSPTPPSILLHLRNMWQFASFCQWFYIFGGVVKFDNVDIDELEAQCLSPHSTILEDIGLSLLKFLSSHRGLTHDLFDEYTRRQYAAKVPEKPNPFGTDEVPAKFSNFDVFKKIRVLHQMTLFIMMNSEKLRDKMAEQKDADHDQTSWRIEPFGWDSNDYTYYVLDDNRIYRLTEPPPQPSKPKKNTKKARAEARRATKRRRVSGEASANGPTEESGNTTVQANTDSAVPSPFLGDEGADDGLGGVKWECVAVTLDEIRHFLSTIPGKKDPNEMVLRKKIIEHLLPIVEQQEERRQRREKERQKELRNLERMAHAKRSSRIASRQEQQKQHELLFEEENRKRREQEALRKEEQKRQKMEKERDNRLLSREKRLREREIRRAQHQEELAQLSEESSGLSKPLARISERRREAEIEKNREALRELEQEEEEEWTFDCVCGLHGRVDDGQHSVSCERCNIWQHSKCLGIDEEEAEKDHFHFICDSCRRRTQETENYHPRPQLSAIKIKILPTVTPLARSSSSPGEVLFQSTETGPPANTVQYNNTNDSGTPSQPVKSRVNTGTVANSTLGPPRELDTAGIPLKADAAPPQPSLAPASGLHHIGSTLKGDLVSNGSHSPFSTPHPELSPPGLSPRKLHAYGTIYEQAVAIPQGRAIYKPTERIHSRPATAATPELPLHPKNGNTSLLTEQMVSPKLQVEDAAEEMSSPQRRAKTSLLPQHLQPTINGPTSDQIMPSISTPRLHHQRSDILAGMRREQNLFSSSNVLSPTKQSPAVTENGKGFLSSSPAPPIFPPTTALSPSAPKLDLTPPVKSGMVRPQSP